MPSPANTTAPVLSGTQEVGYTLTCSTGAWSHGVDSYAYQWQEQKAGEHPYEDILGATSNSYLVIASDQAHLIRCKVIATNQDGSTIAYSDATVAIPNDWLVVEDGTGKDDSNTYASLEYADNYFAVRNNAEWAALNIGQRKASLISGAAYIDLKNFTGQKNTLEQAMQWPRTGAKVDGFSIESSSIPKQLKDANCEAALRASSEPLIADIEPGNITDETVDVITVTYSDYSNNGQKSYPYIDALLRKFVLSGGNYHRTVRT